MDDGAALTRRDWAGSPSRGPGNRWAKLEAFLFGLINSPRRDPPAAVGGRVFLADGFDPALAFQVGHLGLDFFERHVLAVALEAALDQPQAHAQAVAADARGVADAQDDRAHEFAPFVRLLEFADGSHRG